MNGDRQEGMRVFKRMGKTRIAIELKDYMIRAIVKKGEDSDKWGFFEAYLPTCIIVDTIITDEMALFEFIKERLAIWVGKGSYEVSFFVPDNSVLLRTFSHPNDVTAEELKGYVEMEIGNSIHLPFDEPLVDVYDPTPADGEAVLFAAPAEEVLKISAMLQDMRLIPMVADVRALSNIRFLEKTAKLAEDKTYLIADWSINELSVAIYTAGHIEFLRYQSINADLTKWQGVEADGAVRFSYDGDRDDYRTVVIDQVLEIDRMMNFFKFSLHQGEKGIDEIIILGDNPVLTSIYKLLAENIQTPLILIDDEAVQQFYPQARQQFATLIGLAIKER